MEMLEVGRAVGGHHSNTEFRLECNVAAGRIVCTYRTAVSKAGTN